MKGLGVFSPSSVTSRYVLVASGLYDYSGNGTPRVDGTPLSLDLLDFKVTEKVERDQDPFSPTYDNGSSFNQFTADTPFSFSGTNFDDYMSTQSTKGIAEFSVLHSCPVDMPNGYLTSLKWLKLGPAHGDDKTLFAVGSSSGEVHFYDGEAFVMNKAVVSTFSTPICNVPLKCLAYCGKNMLGVAGQDGQVSALDLGEPGNFGLIDVSYGKWKVGMVTSLSWNYRLSHILASAGAALVPSDTSGVVVWDLKAKKPSFSFRDPGGRVHPVALDWVPGASTQLVVAYGDDNAPALQLWDLRKPGGPQSEVKGHTRGLTDLKFSPHDPNLLMTSSKDDTTKCWHLSPENEFVLLSSIQTEALSHHSRVEWHLTVPGLFLSQATDGELCVHHLFSGKVEGNYMPLWTRKRGGVASGFAGQVTTWNASEVKNYTLSSEYDMKTEKLLDNTLQVLSVLHDETMFTEFCQSKVEASTNEFDKLTWSVLKSQYQGELKDLLHVLGYPTAAPPVQEAVVVNATNAVGPTGLVHEPVGHSNASAASHRTSSSYLSNRTSSLSEELTHDDKEAEDFFNSLTLNTNPLDFTSGVDPVFSAQDPNVFGKVEPTLEVPPVPLHSRLDWCTDTSLRTSLVNANYLEAANRCLELNKVVECLLLAYVEGEDAFLELVRKVVDTKKDPFLNLVHLLMQRDVELVLSTSTPNDWKETLCVLYTYTPDVAVFRELASRFGKRLLQHGLYQEASVCFILATDYHEVVRLWKLHSAATTGSARSHSSLHAGGPMASSRLEEKMDMLLKMSVLSFSMGEFDGMYGSQYGSQYGGGNENFDAVLMELSEVFVDAGKLEKALDTLNVRGASNSEKMLQMKSKIENQLVQMSQPAVDMSMPESPDVHAVSHQMPHHVPTASPTYQPQQTPVHSYQHPGLSYPGAQQVHRPATPSFAGASPAPYQPTSAPAATGVGLNTAPQPTLSRTVTTTRTVPLTALQPSGQAHHTASPTMPSPAPRPSASMTSYSTTPPLTSTHTATTGLTSSTYPASNASQYSADSGVGYSAYSTLTHQTSNASYAAHATPGMPTPGQYGSQTARPSHSQAHTMSHPVTSRPSSSAPATQTFSMPSSAPGAVAGAVKPGMPIPWPNPTPTQQMSSKTMSTQESNRLIISSTQEVPQGEKMPKADLDLVVRTLNALVANLGTSRMDMDNKKNVSELVNSLNQGLLTAEANSLLSTFCKALSNGDHFNSNAILNTMINNLWNNENKPWIMVLKRLLPKAQMLLNT